MPIDLDIHPSLDAVAAPATDEASREPVQCTADLAECTCPDFCERDHANE